METPVPPEGRSILSQDTAGLAHSFNSSATFFCVFSAPGISLDPKDLMMIKTEWSLYWGTEDLVTSLYHLPKDSHRLLP